VYALLPTVTPLNVFAPTLRVPEKYALRMRFELVSALGSNIRGDCG
jgi:hypothetical protein